MTGSPWTLAIAGAHSAARSPAAAATVPPPRDSTAAAAAAADRAAPPRPRDPPGSRAFRPRNPPSTTPISTSGTSANINGSPVAKDGNGYISRLKGDGTSTRSSSSSAASNGVQLDAPKGMALQGDTLWVADITTVRGFNRQTGAPVASVAVKGSKFLNDVAVGDRRPLRDRHRRRGQRQGLDAHRAGPDLPDRAERAVDHRDPERQPGRPQRHHLGRARARASSSCRSSARRSRAWTPGTRRSRRWARPRASSTASSCSARIALLVTSWADSSLFVLDNGTVTPVAQRTAVARRHRRGHQAEPRRDPAPAGEPGRVPRRCPRQGKGPP